MMKDLKVSSKTKMVRGGWLVVGLLCVVGCLNYLDRVMIPTMHQSIVGAIPMSEAQFGLLTSVFLWVYGLLSPIAGFLADKFNRSKVIIASLFLWSAVTWLTAHAKTFDELLATRALMGISEACYLPAAVALIVDYHRGRTRSLATGIHMAGIMVGQSLAFLGGWIAQKSGWNAPFYVFGVIGIGFSILLAVLLHDAPEKDTPETFEIQKNEGKVNFFTGIKILFMNSSFILLLVFWSLMGVVGWMIIGWLPVYYKEHFHLSQAIAGLYATGYLYPMSLAGSLVGGFLTDLWSRKNPAGRILVPAVALLIAAPAVFISGNTTLVIIAIIGFMIYAFTRIFSDVNIMPVLCLIIDSRYRATAYGVLNLFACVIGGLGIYGSGLLRDQSIHMDIIFKGASVLLLLCAGLLWLIRMKIKTASK